MADKMLAIGVDPDSKHSGWAAVQSFNGGYQIVQVGLVRAKGKLAADRRATMAKSLRSTLDLIELPYGPTALALEWQHLRGNSSREKNPAAIVELNAFSGMALQGFMDRWHFDYVFTPVPKDWKGSVPKEIKLARILSHLHLRPDLTYKSGYGHGLGGAMIRGAENIPKSMRSHVIDALGLAVWALDPHGPIMDARVSAAAKARR